MLQLRSKFQVSTFSRFKVIAFFIFVYEFVKYDGKNIRTSDAKRRGSLNSLTLRKLNLNLNSSITRERIQIQFNPSLKQNFITFLIEHCVPESSKNFYKLMPGVMSQISTESNA